MGDLSLLNIVKFTILTENRIDDAKKLAQQIGVESDFDKLVSISESINPNHKYLQWLVNNITTLNTDLNDVVEVLRFFDKNSTKFNKRDINQYSSFQELNDEAQRVSNFIRREIEIPEGSTVLLNNDKFIVVIPETKAASCKLGAGTTWCTTMNDRTYYEDYKAEGELYYIISKTKPTSDDTYKMAVRFIFNDGNYPPQPKIYGIYNTPDKEISKQVLIDNSSPEVLDVIAEDFRSKWNNWWSRVSEDVKQKYEEESERQSFERQQREIQQRIENQREAARRLARRQEQAEMRERGEYDDNEEVHALRQYLISIGDWTDTDTEEVERISSLITDVNEQIEVLEQQLEQNPENEQISNEIAQIRERLDKLETELDEATGNDIYNLHKEGYDHYGLNVYTNEHDGSEWAIGTDDEADDAAYKQVENFIEEFKDQPGMGFSNNFIDDYIDAEQVVDYLEDSIESMVRDSPESYIDDDDMELSEEGKEAINKGKIELEKLENEKTEIEDKMSELDSDSDEYSELDTELDELNDKISELESEIEDIENDSDYKEYSEEAIEEAIENHKNQVRRDPVGELREYGFEDMSQFINEDELIKGVIASDGRGNGLSGYDGMENETYYDGTTYFIYRIN